MSFLQVKKVGQDVSYVGMHACCNSSERSKVGNKGNESKTHPLNTENENTQERKEGLLSNLMQRGLNILTQPFSCIQSNVAGVANALLNAFSPFVSFINLTDSNKKTVKDLTQVLLESKTKLDNDKSLNVSKETKEAINRLYESLSKVAQREDLQNVDISELIKRWSQNPNSRILFELAERLQNGRCAPFRDEKYKEALIRSLRVLAEGLDEISNQPRTPQTEAARQEVIQAANPVVDTVQLHEERGGDANFTWEDRRQVAENFTRTHAHIQNLVNNPSLSSCLSSTYHKLCDLVSIVRNFLRSWFSSDSSEEAKKEAERICQERQANIKKIDEICRRHKIKKKRAEEFYSMMEKAKEKLMNFLSIKNTEKLKSNVKTRKYYHAKSQVDENNHDFEYAKAKYRYVSSSADYYKNLEEQNENSLDPSYFCESNVIDLELNIHC